MFAESSASDLFRKFMGNETICSTSQMARKPMNVNKNQLYQNINIYDLIVSNALIVFEYIH